VPTKSNAGKPSNGQVLHGLGPLDGIVAHGKSRSGQTRQGIPWNVEIGDAREVVRTLKKNHFRCVVTSPPYFWQRDYKVEGQIGLESDIQGYVDAITGVMDLVKQVLHQEGLLFLNLGDTYYSAKGQPKGQDKKNSARRFGLRAVDASGLGVPRKTILGIPWRVALEMIKRDWILRTPIVWRRKGSLPEPTAIDRPWRTHEMLFMFSKSPKYKFFREHLAGEEDVWTIPSQSKVTHGRYSGAFPEALVDRCLRVGCIENGAVLDPFAGSGTVLRAALRSGRPATGIDINSNLCDYVSEQLAQL